MNETKYQVISVYDGIWHHEGFFAGEQQAEDIKKFVAIKLEYAGIDGKVFVKQMNLEE